MKRFDYKAKLNVHICKFINRHYDELDSFFIDIAGLKLENYYQYLEFSDALQNLARGKKSIFHKKKYISFYNKYKELLDDCFETNLFPLTVFMEDFFYEYTNYDYYLEYVKEHSDSIDRINSVLVKFYCIGIKTILFAPDEDFSNITSLDIDEQNNSLFSFRSGFFEYMDDIHLIPSFELNEIRYNGIGSNYSISVKRGKNGFYQSTNGEAVVNNFLFDPSLIPDDLSDVYRTILGKKKDIQTAYDFIRDATYLAAGIQDIQDSYIALRGIVNKLKTVEDKTKINDILVNIEDSITELTAYTDQLVLDTSMNDDNIIPSDVQSEKGRYLHLREQYKYDID